MIIAVITTCTRTVMNIDTVKTGLKKSRSGSIGSTATRSRRMSAPVSTSPPAIGIHETGAVQPPSRSALPMPRRMGVAEARIRSAPHQSIWAMRSGARSRFK